MLSGTLNNIKSRLIITLIIAWFGGAVMLIAVNAEVFFSIATGQKESYNTITAEQMKNKLPVEGNLYLVYGLVADGYTENVDDSGNKTISNKEYYYAVPFDDDSVMIILTRQESKIDKQIDALYEASYGDGNDPLLMTGVQISGILRPTELDVIKYTKEAFQEAGINNIRVEPYTLDCKKSLNEYVKLFWAGVALLVTFIGAVIFFIVKVRATNRANSFAAASSSVRPDSIGTYSPNLTYSSSGSSNRYDPDRPFSSADRSPQNENTSSAQTYIPQYQQSAPANSGYGSSFQSQQRSQSSGGYGSTFRSQQSTQSSSGYGSTFQSQQRSQSNGGYGSTFQSQQRSQSSGGYGSTFQSQQRSQPSGGYGSTYQSQQNNGMYTSSAQTYRPQSQQTYGTSYRSQENDQFESGFGDDWFSGMNSNE